MNNLTEDDEYIAHPINPEEWLQFVNQLEKEHFTLAQELNQFYTALQTAKGNNGHHEGGWMSRISDLRERVLSFIKLLEAHLEAEEQTLLPAMELYCRQDHTFPSVRFSSLLMEQHYYAARAYFQMFIDQTNIPREPYSKNEVNKMVSYLREGLIMLSEYFKVEQKFVLTQAEQMIRDM